MGLGAWYERVAVWSSWYEHGYRGWGWGWCGCELEVSGNGGLAMLLLVAANMLSDRLTISMARPSIALETRAKESLSQWTVFSLLYVIWSVMSESEMRLSDNGVKEVVVARGGIGIIIISKLLSTALANSAMDCISDVRLLGWDAVSLDPSVVQGIVFVVVSIVIAILVVIGSIKSAIQSMA